jgi:hypothetical protein
LDIKVAEASRLYKFYLMQEQKILGGFAVIAFLTVWEFMGQRKRLAMIKYMAEKKSKGVVAC